jgi:hypothetical protein
MSTQSQNIVSYKTTSLFNFENLVFIFYSGVMETDIEILFNYKSVREQEGAKS